MTNRLARIVVLISGAGSIMAALASACEHPESRAMIAAVISDRADAGGLAWASEAGIPTAIVSPNDFPDRATWDAAIARAATAFDPDLVVCAGFMRLLGAPVLQAFPGRIVNTHPALLPAFPGAHAVKDALAAGVKVAGCTVMIVDEGVDTGPILAQRAVTVREDDTEASLHERIKTAERELVVDTVGAMLRWGWTVEGKIARVGTMEGTAV